VLRSAAQGIRAVTQDRDLSLIMVLAIAQTLTKGALTVLLVVVAIDLLGTGEPGVGTLTAGIGVGAVLGALGTSMLVDTRRLGACFAIGVALWGLPLLLIDVFPQQVVAFCLLAFVGVGNSLVDLGAFTLMGRMAPDEVLARVFGVLESLVALSTGVGAIGASLVIDLSGTRGGLVAAGLLGPVAAAGAWRRLRHLDRSMDLLDQEVAVMQRVPMLRLLPLPAIERLARGAEPVTCPAGTAVFDQGDVGDRYYLIESGQAEVVGDGQVVTTLQAGEGFGEVALLRRVRRTATIRALTELRLLALRSEVFLPVVLGFTPSATEAGTAVDAMLDRFTPEGGAEKGAAP
jgi:hypothetical protein